MPTYEYDCPKCRKSFTRTVSFQDFEKKRKEKCPHCRTSAERVIAPVLVKTSKKS
jgi:putative FmdB family regulatory protein